MKNEISQLRLDQEQRDANRIIAPGVLLIAFGVLLFVLAGECRGALPWGLTGIGIFFLAMWLVRTIRIRHLR